jgi:hypothetical protein
MELSSRRATLLGSIGRGRLLSLCREDYRTQFHRDSQDLRIEPEVIVALSISARSTINYH